MNLKTCRRARGRGAGDGRAGSGDGARLLPALVRGDGRALALDYAGAVACPGPAGRRIRSPAG